VWDVDSYLDLVCAGRPNSYPRPRPLTAAEQQEIQRREAYANDLCNAWLEKCRAALFAGDARANADWTLLCTVLTRWARTDVWRRANPGQKPRFSRRIAVRRYRAAVEQFCERWRLCAPWAVPLIVYGHFLWLRLPAHLIYELFITSAVTRAYEPIVVRLPGRSEAAFHRDRPLASVRLSQTWDADARHPIEARRRPTAAEMMALEQGGDAACVVVDWQGQARFPSLHDPTQRVDIAAYVVERCEQRLGRRLHVRERRAVRQQIDPQIRRARAAFLAGRFEVDGRADRTRHVRWMARRLLRPHTSYAQLSRITPKRNRQGEVELPEPMTVRNACLAFARRAGLTLP
jgi:hypothetical protein